MIIIGYQGIGKSTTSMKSKDIIDLESSNFWIPAKDVYTEAQSIRSSDAKYRHSDWFEEYCNVAEDLSRQGYIVFISSHEPVRKRLQNSNEIVVAIAPAPTTEMETVWIDKLKTRYENSKTDKDFKALKNAEDRYKQNISEIFEDIPIYVMIHDPGYDLMNIINLLNLDHKEIGWDDDKRDYVKWAAVMLSKTIHMPSYEEWNIDQIKHLKIKELQNQMKEFATNPNPNK